MQPPEATDTSEEIPPDRRSLANASGALSCATSLDTACLWRVTADANLQWRHWGEETIVYHPPSGDTHCLNPLAAAVLKHLQAEPASLEQLVAMLSHELELADATALTEQLGALLVQFHELGVIEPCDARQ